MGDKIKILVCGDVDGKVSSFFARITTVNRKSGPFDLVLCVGNFFGPQDELDDYKQNRKTIDIPVYILGPNSGDAVRHYRDIKEGDICTNLTYLGKRGIYTTTGGLKIAYVSGVEATRDDRTATWMFDRHDVVAVRDSCLASLSRLADFRGIDILLTSQWPTGVKEGEKNVSRCISWLAGAIKPRYHFCGLNGTFYESPPFRHSVDKDTQMELATRFIALAPFGNAEKRKHIYALSMMPVEKMRTTELIQRTTDEIPSPYVSTLLKEEEGKARERSDNQYFYDMNTYDDPRRNKRRSQGNSNHEQQKRSKPPPTFEQEQCWFCLSSGSIEKHLIISVGDHFYLALAKGPIDETHILILPITHIQCAALLSDEQWPELAHFKAALTQFFKDREQNAFFYERNYRTGHLQINAIGIDDGVSWKIQHVLEDKAEEHSLQLETVPKLAGPSDLPQRTPYFVAELPDGKVMQTKQMKGFPLHFGREVICADNLLNCEEKTDWRKCDLPKEEEEDMVKRFRDSFKPYDFTL